METPETKKETFKPVPFTEIAKDYKVEYVDEDIHKAFHFNYDRTQEDLLVKKTAKYDFLHEFTIDANKLPGYFQGYGRVNKHQFSKLEGLPKDKDAVVAGGTDLNWYIGPISEKEEDGYRLVYTWRHRIIENFEIPFYEDDKFMVTFAETKREPTTIAALFPYGYSYGTAEKATVYFDMKNKGLLVITQTNQGYRGEDDSYDHTVVLYKNVGKKIGESYQSGYNYLCSLYTAKPSYRLTMDLADYLRSNEKDGMFVQCIHKYHDANARLRGFSQDDSLPF